MTVPWGRRERWGVESGRVADFVGLLESAELDASGGYCVIGEHRSPHARARHIPDASLASIARSDPRQSPRNRHEPNDAGLAHSDLRSILVELKTKTAHSGRHIASHANDNGRGRHRGPRTLRVSHLSTRNKRPDRWDDRLAPSTNRSSVSDAHAGVGSDPFHAPHPHPSRMRGCALTPRAPTDACEVVP